MNTPRVLALILAGGEGNRLGALTRERAKPVVPFGGAYRLIDFALSNCLHSRLRDVWIIEQFEANSLNQHLKNGRPWDLDQTYGGLQIVPPQRKQEGGKWHEGNADAIWASAREIRAFNPDLLLVLSADAVYRLDYRNVIAAHLEKKAEATLVTTRVEKDEASRFGNVRIGKENRVDEFAYKPDKPISSDVTAEVFVYDAPVLLGILEKLAEKNGGELQDFGDELLPHLVERKKTFAWQMKDYWRDVGTIESYFAAHFEFLGEDAPFRLDDSSWPILSRFAPFGPVRIEGEAHIENSQLGAGCVVRGRVENTIMGPGAVVEANAVVRKAILGAGAIIKSGVRVERAIVDEGAVVSEKQVGDKEIRVVAASKFSAP